MAYAAVLPEPVRARTRMSLPCNANGIACSCIGNGFCQPSEATACKQQTYSCTNSTVLTTVFAILPQFPQMVLCQDSLEGCHHAHWRQGLSLELEHPQYFVDGKGSLQAKKGR